MNGTKPWLPRELKGWEKARKLLGLLLGPKVKVSGENYHLLHRDKLADLVKKEEDPQSVLENLLPKGWERLPGKVKPEELVEYLAQDPAWRTPSHLFLLYLRKEVSLKELKKELALDKVKESRVKEEAFLKELRDLSLREYLELAM